MDSDDLVYLIESDNPVRLGHLATLVMSGVLLGRPVMVVWMGAALGRLVSGALDAAEAESSAEAESGAAAEPRTPDDSGTPAALLREARLLGAVTYLACSADAQRLGRSRAELLTILDDVLAMTTILRRIHGAGMVLYL